MIQNKSTGAVEATSLIVLTIPGLFYRVNGFFTSAGLVNTYIQLHDSATLPGNGAVPLKSWIAQPNFEYNEHVGDGIPCYKGIVLALSTTPDTLTLDVTGGDSANIQVEYEKYDTQGVAMATQATVGPLGAGALQQIWTQASGPKKLLSFSVTEQNAVASFIGLYAKDAPTVNVDKPIYQWPLPASGTVSLDFGPRGIQVFSDKAGGTYYLGCTLGISLTSGVYDAAGSGVATAKVLTGQ